MDFLDQKWIIVSEEKNNHLGQKVEDLLYECSHALGSVVEYACKIGLKNVRDSNEFKLKLDKYIKTNGKPIIVVFIIPKEDKYKDFKQTCYDHGIRS